MLSRWLVGGCFAHQFFNATKSKPLLPRLHQLPRLPKRMAHSSLDGIDLGGMRKAYKKSDEAFLESDMVSTDPLQQFGEWFKIASEIDDGSEANAMVLATATK